MKQKDKQYYYNLLKAIADKSTCDRAKISAIIVKDKITISSGYNGSPRKKEECDDAGHLIVNNHCIRAVHAEENAIINAARLGISIDGCEMISLYKPCYSCMKRLINSGIKNCYYFEDYKDDSQKLFEKNSYCEFTKVEMPITK